MNNYEVFKSFYEEEQAIALHQFLKEKGIDAVIVKNKRVTDKMIGGDGLEKDLFVKINPADFDHANRLIDQQVELNISQLEPDYYLFSFADEELFEIVQKADEWNNQDVILAKKILKDRGFDLSESQVKEMRSTRIKELSIQEEESPSWIVAAVITAFLIPPLGLILGLSLMQSKKVLPDGNKIFSYTAKVRSHGQTIVVIACIMIAAILIKLVGSSFVD